MLNGWKDISGYLKCGIPTAQRWHRELHLPVMRVRHGKRGPVTADSKKLDDWSRQRALLAGLTEKTSELRKTTAEVSRDFLWTELSTGREFLRLALSSTTSHAIARRTRAARLAYNTVHRLLDRNPPLTDHDLNRIRTSLREFRRDLQKLGEKF